MVDSELYPARCMALQSNSQPCGNGSMHRMANHCTFCRNLISRVCYLSGCRYQNGPTGPTVLRLDASALIQAVTDAKGEKLESLYSVVTVYSGTVCYSIAAYIFVCIPLGPKQRCQDLAPTVIPDVTPEVCDTIGKSIYNVARRALDKEILESARLYMLHGRREPLEDEAPRRISLLLRHYLVLVVNSAHRKALTRLLLSQHPLAIERMRYTSRYRRVPVPRENRLCRFGCLQVESVEHALLLCRAHEEVIERRAQFIEKVMTKEPRLANVSVDNATVLMRALIFRRDTVCQIAKLAHQVFNIFSKTPMVWPENST